MGGNSCVCVDCRLDYKPEYLPYRQEGVTVVNGERLCPAHRLQREADEPLFDLTESALAELMKGVAP